MSMNIFKIDRRELKRDPAEMGALDANGKLLVHPAEFWRQFSQLEISAFCAVHGLYCVPTTELIAWLLREIVSQHETIEIGAGNGVLARALGIVATDNKMQLWPEIAMMLRLQKQGTVNYGPNIVEYEAAEAIRILQPEAVIGAWITHRYDSEAHWRGGNAYGVVEQEILRHARYCFIGNRAVHSPKPLLQLAHQEYSFPWLVSRSLSPEENFIAVWEKS